MEQKDCEEEGAHVCLLVYRFPFVILVPTPQTGSQTPSQIRSAERIQKDMTTPVPVDADVILI
jgi:hypothetical protein